MGEFPLRSLTIPFSPHFHLHSAANKGDKEEFPMDQMFVLLLELLLLNLLSPRISLE
jgi:hypothetical protein